MPRLPVPSISLLRAFTRPPASTCTACQTRCESNFMPRHKYAKVNRLDKLHRAQKAALRHEREESHNRAIALAEAMKTAPETINAADLPFHVGRTKTKNLAVYETTKAGGSKHITELKKVSGDLGEIQRQLRAVLQLPETLVDSKGRKKEPIYINQLTQHIIIKGWRGPEIKKWAETLGF